MTPVIKRCLGFFICLTVSLVLAGSALSTDAQEAQQPTAGSQSAAESPQVMEQRHEQMAKEMESDPCQMMKSSGMDMGGMGGMQQMAMPKMIMRGPGPMGMGGMGMPMMQGRMMMMHMMAHNPKLAGKMLQMRADMMRAIADVLTKYGKEMESGEWPTMQMPARPAK